MIGEGLIWIVEGMDCFVKASLTVLDAVTGAAVEDRRYHKNGVSWL